MSTRRRRYLLTLAAGSFAVLIIVVGVMGWCAWQKRSDEAWLDPIVDLAPEERTAISQITARPDERNAMLAELRKWDRCVKRYRRDGAADARLDFERHRAQPYWGHNGGNVLLEWVPGLEGTCAPPLPAPGVNLPPEVTSRRGDFRALDQMGAEFEDGQWRTGLTERCDRASRTYAAMYNRALSRLDPGAFRQCGAVTDQNRAWYRY